MSKVLVVDDYTPLTTEVIRVLSEAAPYVIRARKYIDNPNVTPNDRDHGWYRKFEKKSKKSKFK